MTALDIIRRLQLEPLEHEGGFFQRVFTSEVNTEFEGVERPAATVIYFLVTPEDFSALHKLALPEFYTHIAGDALDMCILDPADGSAKQVRLGSVFEAEATNCFQVSEQVWQGSRLAENGTHGWALVTCTLGPGFDWSDFELGDRANLVAEFPAVAETIKRLTR